jgi:hypothetical protein
VYKRQKEIELKRVKGINALPQRKKKSKYQNYDEENFRIKKNRKVVETSISTIIRKFPRAFYVRTIKGFQVRVLLCIIAPMLTLCGALPH